MSESKKKTSGTRPGADTPENARVSRDERRYSVGVQRGRARRKVRYIETNDPKKGCRFL